MLNFIDDFLNRTTMYRLVLYVLIFLLGAALIISLLGWLPFSAGALIFSTAVLLAVSWLTNFICAKFLRVPANSESIYITALILALIISPPAGALLSNLPFLVWAAILSQASKYILNWRNKHIFNPAALAVAITYFTMNQSASWWIGTSSMLAFTAIGGFLIVKKTRRFRLVAVFAIAALAVMLAFGHVAPLTLIQKTLLDSPLVFFAGIMLTEPLTIPQTNDGRLAYGVLVGWLFAPQTHFSSFYFTPELALLAGNVFAYAASPKERLMLKLKQIRKAGEGVYDFIFENRVPFSFRPGQYMEWTLAHQKTDARGNRRYFTLANSPTEDDLLLGVKFYPQSSSYKRALAKLKPGDQIVAGQLAGDFVLPDDKNQKLVFVAGGIGITPFRSMLKYLIDKNEKRPITVLYSCRNRNEIAYFDVLQQAGKLGIATFCTLTDGNPPAGWQGMTGHFNAQKISAAVPDYKQRTFYISGSDVMVKAIKKTLRAMDVPRRHIKTDFFPGLA